MSAETINNRLKEARLKLGLAQKDMAQKLSVKASYYSDIENGRRNVSTKFLNKLCYDFPISRTYLLTGIGELFTPKKEILLHQLDAPVDAPVEKHGNFSKISSPYNYYSDFTNSELDFELSIAIEKVRDVFNDLVLLTQTFHHLKPPKDLIEKFPLITQLFNEYIRKCEEDFSFVHPHLKDEQRKKIMQVIYFQDDAKHIHDGLTKLIVFMHRYAELGLLTNLHRKNEDNTSQ